MRLVLTLLCLAYLGCAEESMPLRLPSQPSGISNRFTYRMAICPTDTIPAMTNEKPCAEIGQVTGSVSGFTIRTGIEYQFQLLAYHPGRQGCRMFGFFEMIQKVVSQKVVTFTYFEDANPSPAYLGGLRFLPQTVGVYQITITATDSCDVPMSAIAPASQVKIVVE